MSGQMLHGQKSMPQFISLHSFSADEQHRAENLADLLEEGGLNPALDYDDDGSAYVSVAADERAQGEAITAHFVANYDGALNVLVASQARQPLSNRIGAYAYGAGIPALVIVGSVWVLVGRSTPEERVGAVIALIVMVPWLIAFSLMVRRRAV